MAYDVVLPSAVQAASGNSNTFVVPQDADLRAELDVTADVVGTTLDVVVQHSNDGGTTWFTIGTFTQVGATTPAQESIAIHGPSSGQLRINFTIVGTSYTFSVSIRRQ